MGEERIAALLQESLSVAVKTGAMKPQDTRRVIVDTTVQPKNVMFPTDAGVPSKYYLDGLPRQAAQPGPRMVGQAGEEDRSRPAPVLCASRQEGADPPPALRPRQAVQARQPGLAHAPDLSRPHDPGSRRPARSDDIRRQIAGEEDLEAIFRRPLYLAGRVLEQRQRQRGRKVYSLHAPEVECIGKGKSHAPYEFGVKVSVATTLKRSKGGQFALHAKALPGSPYDGHTLASLIPDMENTIGNEISRILADAGYRGHPRVKPEGRLYTAEP